jgi:hypothetical protein
VVIPSKLNLIARVPKSQPPLPRAYYNPTGCIGAESPNETAQVMDDARVSSARVPVFAYSHLPHRPSSSMRRTLARPLSRAGEAFLAR